VDEMSVWRLLRLETSDAFMNMAVDEAVLRARIEGIVPNTLRFFRWKPSAVSVGRFQDLSNVVNIENCKKHRVDIVRRISGGGAVYHDHDGEITYSVVVSLKDLGSADMISAYKLICNGLIEAIQLLGIEADFSPGDSKQCPNITVNGRKISGSAQSYKRGVLLQHGTLLVDADLMKMFTFLKVSWTQSCIDIVNVAQKKHTSIKQELGSGISLNEAYKALVGGFEKALNTEMREGKLTSYERSLAQKLCKEKFATDDWNLHGKAPD